jgi:hypothetical protein
LTSADLPTLGRPITATIGKDMILEGKERLVCATAYCDKSDLDKSDFDKSDSEPVELLSTGHLHRR